MICYGILLVADRTESLQRSYSWIPNSQPYSQEHQCALQLLVKATKDEEYLRPCRSCEGIYGLPEDNCIHTRAVQEVVNFKKFLHGYQHDGANKLIELGEMHLFNFYVEKKGNDMGWLVMHYKVRFQIFPM